MDPVWAGFAVGLCVLLVTAYHFVFGRSAQISQLRREVAELAVDVEHMQQLHHRARRRENVEGAQEAKAAKSQLVRDAEAALAASAQPELPLPPAQSLRALKEVLRKRHAPMLGADLEKKTH